MSASADHNQDFDRLDAPPSNMRWLSKVVKGLAVLAILGLLFCLLLPVMRTAWPAAYRNQCTSNLKQIAVALQNYEQIYHALPPAYTTDSDGKPLHSWRTLILPFLEEQQLYKSIDLTKPWDDPANADACKTRVAAYRCPSASIPNNRTTYLAVVAPDGCIRPTGPRNLSDITDGTRTTLLLIEVDSQHAVPWMSPVDADEGLVMSLGPNSPLTHAGGFTVAFVDGHVAFLSADTLPAQRRALISIAGADKAVLDGTE